jgi:hypothetical protein
MVAPRLPKFQPISHPTTGDARLNSLIKKDGAGAALNVTEALAQKVSHKLVDLAKTNPDMAAALTAHMFTLADSGKLKIPAGSHGMDSPERYQLFQPVLQQLNSTTAGQAAMQKYELPAPEGLKLDRPPPAAGES